MLTSLRDDGQTLPLDLATRSELLDAATEQAGLLNRLVENLLNMTRLEAGALHIHATSGDLQEVVGAVLNQAAGLLRDRALSITLPADLPGVQIDAVLTGQVLFNLLENACKYSPTGSPLALNAHVAGTFVELSLSDQGPGIPPEDLERVFDKFYRVQRPSQVSGTGLGLSICRGIVEAQGGKIWIRNNPEGGLTVHLTLPVAASKEAGEVV